MSEPRLIRFRVGCTRHDCSAGQQSVEIVEGREAEAFDFIIRSHAAHNKYPVPHPISLWVDDRLAWTHEIAPSDLVVVTHVCESCHNIWTSSCPRWLLPVFAVVAHSAHEGHIQNHFEVVTPDGGRVVMGPPARRDS